MINVRLSVCLPVCSKTGCTDAAYALQNLALLTPQLAIPPVLEKCVFLVLLFISRIFLWAR